MEKRKKDKEVGMSIEKVGAIVTELQEIINKENEILTKLFVAAKGRLGGRWNHGGRGLDDWQPYDIKVKVEGYHLLSKVKIVSLYKSTFLGDGDFRNERIAHNWAEARNYVSITQVVDAILSELTKKLAVAKKQNLQNILEKVDQVC